MNTKKNIIIIICFTVVISLHSSPVDLMIGARGIGFGGAYSALVNDPSAAYWNPAALSSVERLSIMESNWLFQDVENLNVNYITASFPIKRIGTISGSWLLAHATLEEGWEDNATSSSANENQFSISVGRKLWNKLAIFENTSLGFSLNRYTITTSEDNGAGLGFDVGLHTMLPAGFKLAFIARTLGTEFISKKVDPELRWGLGFQQTIKEMHRISVGIDASLKKNRDYVDIDKLTPADNNLKLYGGLEYAILLDDLEIALRGGANGCRYNTIDSYAFSGGVGFIFKLISLQYAFMGNTNRDASLGYGHRLSLIISFDKKLGKE